MKTDATQVGVSEQKADTDAADQGPVLSDRELAMQEIDSQLSVTAETEPEPEVNTDVPPVLADDQLQNIKVKVKVDGEEVELPLSEVTKDYQKNAAADRRMELAAEERKGLEQLKAQLDERERILNEKPSSPADEPQALDADAGDDVDGQIRAAMAAIVDGDEDGATAALSKILSRQQQPTPVIDEAQLTEKVVQQVEQSQAEKAQVETEAQEWDAFVVDNPSFGKAEGEERRYGDFLFVSKYGPQLEAGEISYREALDKTAADVSAVFAQKTEEPQTDLQKREQRKGQLDSLPTANSRATQQPQAEESAEDVLAEMMAARGQ